MKKTILIILVLAAVVGGCKKYEEGPCISFRSAEHRIYGIHELKSITIDGEEHLNEYLDSLGLYFEFYLSDNNYNDCYIHGVRKDGRNYEMLSSWELINHNKILKTTTSRGNPLSVNFGPFKTNVLPEWKILRLTKQEMKMKTIYEGKEYVVDLKRYKVG